MPIRIAAKPRKRRQPAQRGLFWLQISRLVQEDQRSGKLVARLEARSRLATDLAQKRTGDGDWAERPRAATHASKPLGERPFVTKLEDAAGTNLALRPPGHPRKKLLAHAAAG